MTVGRQRLVDVDCEDMGDKLRKMARPVLALDFIARLAHVGAK